EVSGAVELMVEHGFRHVPVVEAGEVLGLVTLDGRLASSPRARRPVSDFGAPATISGFRGPYADGPPPEALEVVVPPLDSFGFAVPRPGAALPQLRSSQDDHRGSGPSAGPDLQVLR